MQAKIVCNLAKLSRCEFGYSGDACEHTLQENPRYLAEPFTLPIEETANLLEVHFLILTFP